MTRDLRTIREDEFEEWLGIMRLGFLMPPIPGEAAFRMPAIDFARTLGAFDGDRIVGTYRSFGSELTIPGGASIPAGAITNVTMSPTHRRRGFLTQMMREDLAQSKARGETVAMLLASEYPIYGRFGFGVATEHVHLTLDARSRFLPSVAEARADIVSGSTFRALAPAVYERYRSRQAGAIARLDRWWDIDARLLEVPGDRRPADFFVLLYDSGDRCVGYAVYHPDGQWDGRIPNGSVEISALVADTPALEACLWKFLAEIDWIATVKGADRSTDDPLRLFVENARGVKESERSDFLWLRILDTPEALSRRAWSTDGELLLGIQDPLGLADGAFRLRSEAGRGTCEVTDAEPDLRMPVSALAAAYLGNVTFSQLAGAGLVEASDPKVLHRADLMFSTECAPWCNTWF